MAAGASQGGRTDAARNHERLLAAALAVYADKGVDASLKEVADHAGLGVGTVYRHFPTREALQEAVLSDHLETLRSRAAELAQARPAADALVDWLGEFITHFTQYRGLARAFLPMLSDRRTPLGHACTDMRTAGAMLLEGAQRAGAVRADLDAGTLLRLVSGIAMAAEYAPDGAGPLLPLVLDGILRRPSPETARPDATAPMGARMAL
jgi:AcrR family transcriptional regulator